MRKFYPIILGLIILSCTNSEKTKINTATTSKSPADTTIIVGAEQISTYIKLLDNKRVALLVNHSSLVKNKHLVDTLLSLGINIKKIFAPEHGFRGNKERGQNYSNNIDQSTGLPIISLIGKKKRPQQKDLSDVDILIYDIQDVGVRFYTYISSMYYFMQSSAEFNKPLIILDRPNPNGDYIAGPVLDTVNYRSFVGMLPIPIVYGLTPGELALMINGEAWLKGHKKCKLTVVKIKNYNHKKHYSLPVKPSPNLPNDLSIRLYPSLCFFEATEVSVGRGTDFPFQLIGYPDKRFGTFSFVPHDINNVQTNPIQEGKKCYGLDLRNQNLHHKFTLSFLINFMTLAADDIKIITNQRWFNLLMGNDKTIKLLLQGKSETEIEKTWQIELDKYKQKREKYLLYN